MPVRLAWLTCVLMLVASSGFAAGRIVVGHDVNTLSSSVAGPNEDQFAVNIANWLTGATSGKILAVESSPGDGTRDYAPSVKAGLASGGFTVTYISNPAGVSALTLVDLQTYSAVFVGETYPTQASISSSVLTQYVDGGGNVYVYGGVDGNPAGEAAFFNPFLQVFGLSFDTTSYNGLTSVNVTSTHPIFDGLTGKTLGSGNGQDIHDLVTNPNASIVQFQGQHGVYAVVNHVATPLVVNQLGAAGPSNFTILSLGGTSSEIHFNHGTVQGNAGVANTGEYKASGSTVLTGILYLGSQSTAKTSGGAQIQGGIQQNASSNALLNQAVSDALKASSYFKSLAATITVPGNSVDLSGHQTLTVTGTAGTNVLNLKCIRLTGGSTLILSAPAGAQFIINNSGELMVAGGANIVLQGGLTPCAVLFNQTAQAVDLSGASNTSGILLAPTFGIDLGGTFTGEVIGAHNCRIQIHTQNAFQPECATVPPPILLSIVPASGQQGQQNLSVSITGQNTHFVQGTTTASLGAGITVAAITVNSHTSATAVIDIDPAALVGPRTVTVTTGSEVVSLVNGFTVGTPLPPVLVSVNPNTGQQSKQNLPVVITGQNTHWIQGTTVANFGAGITVRSLNVSSPISATAILNIDGAAKLGPRDVTLTTGVEIVTLVNGFTIPAQTPTILSVDPNSGYPGQQSLGIVSSIFLTGHDPDFHAYAGGNNASGAVNINKRAIGFITDPAFNTFAAKGIHKFLYVSSNMSPPGGHVDGTNGLIASGYVLGTDFDRADASVLTAALSQLGIKYDALVVASDFGEF